MEYTCNFRYKRVPMLLKLGDVYDIWYFNRIITCRLIQPTTKGFNFLNLDTHKCILKRHLYRSKYKDHENGLYLFIIETMYIRKNNEKSLLTNTG